MNLAQKSSCLGVAVASGVAAATVPNSVAATEVAPAIMKQVEERPAAAKPRGALGNKLLIERGRQLFMEETFNGNGRTCASCHPPTNNFTIDPEFIASLPDSDPLFVAEFNPDLAELEDPELMRRFGLILENVDGLDRPGVFRGVPHTLGLRVSTAVDPAGDDNLTRTDGSTVVHATGWSGDGAPGDGSLRSFAIGAIVQHFPKTLNRVEGEDFRLPTESELDALEAFQMSLGRQTELDLATMFFTDGDVQAGKDLFNGIGINRGCAFCHNNAGANNAEGFNRNFATNVAHLATEARGFDPEMPGDGGFDSEPEHAVAGIAASFYGNGSMNSASLVEAADTGPFFHNNSARTIEDAVRFYTTTTFSPDDPFHLDDTQVTQLAAFLRALNALDNVRNVGVLAENAQRQPEGRARETIEVVIADTEDAIEVLTGGPRGLHPEAVGLLDEALALAEAAHGAEETTLRNGSLRQVQHLMNDIPALILQAEPGPDVAEGDGDAAPPPEDLAEGDGDAGPPPEDGAEGDGDAAPPEDLAEGDGDAGPPPEDGAEGDGDAAPPEDLAEGDGDAGPPPEDGAEGDGDAAPPEDLAEGDGDAGPPPEDGAEGDGDAAPPEDLAEGDGDAGPRPEDLAEGDGDRPPADREGEGGHATVERDGATGDGDRSEEREPARDLAAAT